MIQRIHAVVTKVREIQASGKKVVFTNGCFDILHPGHIDFLRRCRDMGDALVVAINSDESVRRIKGPDRPIFDQNERAEILGALEMVDFVTVFHEDTPLQTILAIRPDVLAKGADWGLDGIVGRAEVEGWGGRVEALPLLEGQSTSGIAARILERYSSR